MQSETESSTKPGPFNVLMNMLMIYWVLYNLSGTKWSISAWIKVGWSCSKCSFDCFPSLNLCYLEIKAICTVRTFCCSGKVTICPKDGTTLILMLPSGP